MLSKILIHEDSRASVFVNLAKISCRKLKCMVIDPINIIREKIALQWTFKIVNQLNDTITKIVIQRILIRQYPVFHSFCISLNV